MQHEEIKQITEAQEILDEILNDEKSPLHDSKHPLHTQVHNAVNQLFAEIYQSTILADEPVSKAQKRRDLENQSAV